MKSPIVAVVLVISGLLLTVLVFWNNFVAFSNKWGNVASVVGLVLTLVGFGLTFVGLVFVEAKIQRTVQEAVRRAAAQVLSSGASDVESLLSEFKISVWHSLWSRAIEKCEDAQKRISRIQENPHLTPEENQSLAAGIDDLRMVAAYITRNKLGAEPAARFDSQRMEAVDRVLDCVRAILGRIGNQVWGV